MAVQETGVDGEFRQRVIGVELMDQDQMTTAGDLAGFAAGHSRPG